MLNPLISSLLPPVAMLVPYPVILPIPIPIPIPIPFPFPGAKSDKNTFKKTAESPAPVSNTTSNPGSTNFTARDTLGRYKNSTPLNATTTSSSHFAGSRYGRHLSSSNPAKRVDSVITRLVAPKLAQANLMGKGNHPNCSTFPCGIGSGEFPAEESAANHEAATLLAAALEEGRFPPISASPGSLRMPVGPSAMSSAVSVAVTSAASTSSMSLLQRPRPAAATTAGLDSSSDQSNRLDDSSDLSDFPDSDDLDLADMESDDSRQSDTQILMNAAASATASVGRNFAGIGEPTSAPSLPTLPLTSSLSFHSRERSKEPSSADESQRQVESGLASGEPELKRKCMRTRLTAK